MTAASIVLIGGHRPPLQNNDAFTPGKTENEGIQRIRAKTVRRGLASSFSLTEKLLKRLMVFG